jgi:hypothetical protein
MLGLVGITDVCCCCCNDHGIRRFANGSIDMGFVLFLYCRGDELIGDCILLCFVD